MKGKIFRPDWRSQSRAKRRFFARYMGWLEKTGFVVVSLLLAAFAFSFFYRIEEHITAEDVPIEPSSTAVVAPESGFVVRQLVAEGAEVRVGDALFELVVGPQSRELGPAYAGIARSLEEATDPSIRQRLSLSLAGLGALRTRRVAATAAGAFKAADGSKAGYFEEGTVLGEVLDYSRLLLRPKLAGKSIANARVGQPAVISNVRILSPGDTLLRARFEGANRGSAISRSLAGSDVKDALNRALAGRSVVSREDIPVAIAEVTEVEVESGVRVGPGRGEGTPLDPGADDSFKGRVVQGKHVMSAQIADLPEDARRAAVAAVNEKLLGKSLDVGGKPLSVEEISEPHFVVRLQASGDTGSGPPIPAASLKRTFDAEVVFESAPPELVLRIREAHREGRQVTARVQVRTGTRSVAYFLLRRS